MSGVELERVLADAYPILQAIDPDDLGTVLGELATAADGLGEAINRSLVNGAELLDVQAANDANTRQFLEDLAAPHRRAGRPRPRPHRRRARPQRRPARAQPQRRPPSTACSCELERLSNDASDLLEANTDFIDAVYTDGQATLDTLFANRSQLIPLVIGLRQFAETVGSAARIPVGDGTLMAAVKGFLGGRGLSDPRLPVDPPAAAGDRAAEAPAASAARAQLGPPWAPPRRPRRAREPGHPGGARPALRPPRAGRR